MRLGGLHALLAALVVSGLAAPFYVAPVAPAGAAESSADPRAPASPLPAAEVDRLRERAGLFWAARMAGDTKGQWELLEPRGRNRVSPADYAPRAGVVKYLGFQVEDATVDGFFATVKVRLLVQITPPTMQRQRKIQPSSHLVTDRWVRIGGVWYRSLEQERNEATRSSLE
jgi:hypothetical protein